jgi:hypothetical protein
MNDFLIFILVVIIWYVLQTWLFPMLGIPT